ncbi:hypothetical protein KI809_14295 [Geobacter pelophilus]|jgi:hypothetical protein|uniref:Uncharacterized protein n=1 Tax=Geoanaerobacter pelophilus TaxID=60036 RepID=A0AAW4L6N3_9BACT|nr:hypothetical protein [Geoanaerobacter pelophilus]MBT0665475.1 hypothetical protein [Geoanaerobacter pelophilus]
MSPIKAISSIRGLFFLLACLALTACGDSNSERTLDPVTGKHPENWVLAGHKPAALASGVEACFECHGENGAGGVANIACSDCHIGGPEHKHPVAWDSTITLHGPYANANGIESCRNIYCHGARWEGVVGSGQACSLCHN